MSGRKIGYHGQDRGRRRFGAMVSNVTPFFLSCTVAFLLSGCSSTKPGLGSVIVTDPNGGGPLTSVIVNAKADVSVTVANDKPNLGVDWNLNCGGSPNSIETTNVCGTLNPVHVGSNISMIYTAPAYVPVGNTVTLTASATTDPSVSTSITLTIVPQPVAMTFTTGFAPPAALAAAGVLSLAATVSNDPTAAGVTWSVTCSSADCGAFNPAITASGSNPALYTAPAAIPSGGNVTVTATSIYDKTKSISATISIMPISVSVIASPSTDSAGAPATLTATIAWDASNAGVSWLPPSCSASACGSITSSTCAANGVAPTYTSTCTATFTAPPSIPAADSTLAVTATATSVTDSTKSGSAIITVGPPPPIAVTIAPSATSVQVNGSTTLTANVANDFTNAGVNWQCSPGSCSPASSTSLPFTTTFTAPGGVPSPNPIVVTATSIAAPAGDATGSATASVTVDPAISITLAASNPSTITAGVAATFSATVSNDIAPGGVAWTASCTVASNCGVFTPAGQTTSGNSVTYTVSFTAPNAAPWSENPVVTISATSIASHSAPPLRSASAAVSVIPVPYVSFVPFAPSALPLTNPSAPVLINMTAVAVNDTTNRGVDWSVCSNASICGQFLVTPAAPATLSSAAVSAVFSSQVHAASGQAISYEPPTTMPTGGALTVNVVSTANPAIGIAQSVNITSNLTGSAIKGTVLAGALPVAGASVQLYEAGNSGYGSAAFPLVISNAGNSVTTDQDGNFAIAGGYACDSQNTLLYLVASNGNPGGLGANGQLGLMTALGPCVNVNSSLPVVINEVTTVATAWALVPFTGTDFAHIGSSASNYASGLANAFAAVNNLVNINSGEALQFTPAGGAFTPPGGTSQVMNGLVPQAEINTLADAIHTCTASAGGVPGDGSACDNFFYASNVNPVGGTPSRNNEPSSVLPAVLAVAKYPSRSSQTGPAFPVTGTSLFDLLPSQGNPFTPILSGPPTDWTISLSFSGGGLEGQRRSASDSTALAIDASGNLWVSNPNISSVTEVSNLGVSISPFATGFRAGTGGGFTAGGLNAPTQIAVDPFGSVWALNAGNSLTELDSTGNPVTCGSSPDPFCGGSTLSSPFSGAGNPGNAGTGLAIDANGNVWVAESGTPGDVAEYAGFNGALLNGKQVRNGTALSPAGTGFTNLTSPTDSADTAPANPNGAIAVDASGKIWLLDQGNYAAVELNNTGTLDRVDHGYLIDPTTGKPSGSVLGASTFGSTLVIDRGGDLFIPDGLTGQQMYELFACASVSDPNCIGIGKSVFSDSLNPGFNPPIAIDGAQNLWLMTQPYPAFSVPSAIAEYSTSGTALNRNISSPSFGYTDSPFTDQTPTSIAVDGSGNLWLMTSEPGSGTTLTEFIGVAAPTVTPLSLGKIGAMP